MDLENLSFVLRNIPNVETTQDTFFDILGVQTRETYISKAYNYFLNAENKKIANLFQHSIAEIIKDETDKDFFFDDYYSETEVLTNGGGRIDIVITSSNSENKKIIIENKVFHFLANNLDDYWESTKVSEVDKIGIVLTLERHAIEKRFLGKYINITHQEIVEKIKEKGLPVELHSNNYIYLNDFLMNIENITKNQILSNDLSFFYKNSELFTKAIELKEKFISYIKQQIDSLANKLNLKADHKKHNYSYILDDKKNDTVYYTIDYSGLLEKEKSLNVILELWNENTINKAKEIDIIIKRKYPDFFSKFERPKAQRFSNFSYQHYLKKTYENISDNELSKLDDFMFEKILEDFKDSRDLAYTFIKNT